MFGDIIFRQLFDAASSTYTYVVGDPQSLEAVIIDTVFEQHFRDRALIEELVKKQRNDGGWSLETMGPWKWSKTEPPVKSPGELDASLLGQSDGYATGLVIYTLRQAGVPSSDAALRKGVRWLETNQRPSPVADVPGRAWPTHSLNYDREHGGEKGEPWRRLFMTDTATAFAILALADERR